jgi:hypothetical protein
MTFPGLWIIGLVLWIVFGLTGEMTMEAGFFFALGVLLLASIEDVAPRRPSLLASIEDVAVAVRRR